ncbi:hypothetical protein LU293_07440 [Moraxella nasovis]|uniref:hypothetical protein n=1 Tax=Moraxella nasovis TaxID=2904121 RepID=UPI001F614721|nr:hypothetical protein [Moraxella nasovis]UNU72918.1 hypothetical protein LU293_07440 [Moraxella nasovis]
MSNYPNTEQKQTATLAWHTKVLIALLVLNPIILGGLYLHHQSRNTPTPAPQAVILTKANPAMPKETALQSASADTAQNSNDDDAPSKADENPSPDETKAMKDTKPASKVKPSPIINTQPSQSPKNIATQAHSFNDDQIAALEAQKQAEAIDEEISKQIQQVRKINEQKLKDVLQPKSSLDTIQDSQDNKE